VSARAVPGSGERIHDVDAVRTMHKPYFPEDAGANPEMFSFTVSDVGGVGLKVPYKPDCHAARTAHCGLRFLYAQFGR
jgi:hypothetical protein